MGKRRSRQQRIGRLGEDFFQAFASAHGLISSVPRDDFGYDFLCHVEEPGTGDTREITGDIVGICVRSTSGEKPRVRLDRDDAESLLRAKFVTCFVLVTTGDSPEVFHRFLDPAFAGELADFLASTRSYVTLTPNHCDGVARFDTNLEAALRGNYPERVRIEVARRRLSSSLRNLSVEVRRTGSGELTLVEVTDFYSFFVDATKPQRDDAYAAVFGAPHLRFDRLAKLGPRPEILTEVARLPSPLLIGSTTQSDFLAVAKSQEGSADLPVTRIDTSVHTGWVHDAGFSITFSVRVQRGDHWVHEIEVVIDPDVALDLEKQARLWRFLECCSPDAVIYPEHNPTQRFEARWIQGLHEAHFFARCLRSAATLQGWSAVQAPLDLARNVEALHTMALLAEAATHPQFLKSLGFVVEVGTDHGDYAARPVACEIPVVANLGDHGIVCWMSADADLLTVDGTAHGIKVQQVHGARVEVIAPQVKSTQFPEVVIDPTWPPVTLEHRGGAQSSSNARSWGVELRVTDVR